MNIAETTKINNRLHKLGFTDIYVNQDKRTLDYHLCTFEKLDNYADKAQVLCIADTLNCIESFIIKNLVSEAKWINTN